MANIKHYRKLATNPLGLGRGLVIKDETFTDKDLHEIQLKKLKGALRVGLVEQLDVKVEAKKVANTNDATITDLEVQLAEAKKELAKALTTIKGLQTGDVDAWKTMTAEELAKEYTIPELKGFADSINLEYRSNIKEARLSNKIVETLVNIGDDSDDWKAMTVEELVEAFGIDQLITFAIELELTPAESFTSEDIAEEIVEALQE